MELIRYPDLQRLDDWKPRLQALINERRTMPYFYGANDCWCFAQAGVAAVTGVTLLAEIENPKSMVAAAKILMKHGWETVEGVMTACLGPAMPVEQSRLGDIVSYSEAGELHLSIRVDLSAVSPASHGLKEVDRHRWRCAWKVG